jgi:hypothetical protein
MRNAAIVTIPMHMRRVADIKIGDAQLLGATEAVAISGVDRVEALPKHPAREVQRSGDDARPRRYGSAQCDYRVHAISAISGCARSGQRGPDNGRGECVAS